MDILNGIEKLVNKDKLDKLNYDWAMDIAYLSKGLSPAETLSYYGLEDSELSVEDKKFFRMVTTRARIAAKSLATELLFDDMKSGKIPTTTALSYLTRFADGWKGEGVVGTEEKFTFVMKKG